LCFFLGKTKNEKEEKAVRDAVLGQILDLIRTTKAPVDSNGEKHINIQCSSCSEKPIESDRYKCLNCGDINFCATCFESRREMKQHKSGHVYVHYKFPGELFSEPVREDEVTYSKFRQKYADEEHGSISCDGCGKDAIKGLRFKCDTCSNYDLCQDCVDKGKETKSHKTTHPLIIVGRRAIHQIRIEDIELTDKLGGGAFGTVFKGKWLSKKRTVACKVIDVSQTKEAEVLERSFLKEIAAYAELSGAYILKTYGFAAARQGQKKQYILVMEYMSRGSLAKVVQDESDDLSLRRRLDMARNIASGIRKIHEHGMIHRDIRPDNILVNENYLAKIGDMGIARMTDPLKQHTRIGCQSFMPPEFYKGSYDQKLDIFTFGLTLNVLFTSTEHAFQPFVNNDKIAFKEKSPIFDDLISRCTAYDPDRRPNAIEIEKTFDLYAQGFNEIVIKKHPNYRKLSKDDKDKVFMAFYEQFHTPAQEFIRKQFPSEFLNDPEEMACVKVDKEAGECIRIECGQQ